MDELKQRESIFSNRPTAAATVESQEEAKEIAESLAGKSAASPKGSRYSPVTPSNFARAGASSPVEEFLAFLKQTNRVWLLVVGGILGLILVFTLLKRTAEWATFKRERRQEQAVASVTPERLLARCGQPLEDTTKDDYPILMRTMTYHISRNEEYTFDFSRTAEEKSDWVFLSMKDANGKSYETPEEKVAAMSCLDSRK